MLRDSRKSRAISLIGFPFRCSRRILVIFSTTNIPVPTVRNPNGGASHDEMKGVNFARRSTLIGFPARPVTDARLEDIGTRNAYAHVNAA